MAYAQAPDKPEVVHEYMVALLRIEQTARANTIANLWKDSDNPVLRFDAALAKAFFNEPAEALKIVDEFESWPEGYAERVRDLRQRIVEKFSS